MALLTAFVSFQCTSWVAGQMNIWLKAEGFGVEQISLYPTGGTCKVSCLNSASRAADERF